MLSVVVLMHFDITVLSLQLLSLKAVLVLLSLSHVC